ncbi:hypothetical protein KEM48_005598 [Puccinia striiformis f. sp. tritici PST-130]|nr:hypothetical protein KEM48_005598 [Puccinia striiformis f. sp. tritici PST-130]
MPDGSTVIHFAEHPQPEDAPSLLPRAPDRLRRITLYLLTLRSRWKKTGSMVALVFLKVSNPSLLIKAVAMNKFTKVTLLRLKGSQLEVAPTKNKQNNLR